MPDSPEFGEYFMTLTSIGQGLLNARCEGLQSSVGIRVVHNQLHAAFEHLQ